MLLSGPEGLSYPPNEVPALESWLAQVVTSLKKLGSGIYTPTLTNVTNITASTAFQCSWMRVGDVVLVSGLADVDPAAAGQVQLGISLPVASGLTATWTDLAGVAFNHQVAGHGAAIRPDAANDRALMEWITVDTSNRSMFFIFSYRIL